MHLYLFGSGNACTARDKKSNFDLSKPPNHSGAVFTHFAARHAFKHPQSGGSAERVVESFHSSEISVSQQATIRKDAKFCKCPANVTQGRRTIRLTKMMFSLWMDLHIYIYIFMYICTRISTHMYTYTCTYAYVYIYIYVSIDVYLYICICRGGKGGIRER